MKRLIAEFAGSLLFSLAGLALAGFYAWHNGAGPAGVLDALWIVAVLAVLEISLSFDNAVVNAAVLKDMDRVWQRRFLTWGMLFAVFGTRVVFPLAIVGFTAGLGPVAAITLSLAQPQHYAEILLHAHVAIAGFGGAFLALVGLGFFLDPDKDAHVVGWAERRLARLGSIKAAAVGIVLGAVALIALRLPGEEALRYTLSAVCGIIAFILLDALGALLNVEPGAAGKAAVRGGLGGFLYLNLLDASFSLDGVIGAFALSTNMVIIAIGLSIGALFVRSLTVLMVRRDTLAAYRYLEHGAFWAIIALGAIMLGSVLVEVPEAVTGLIGALLIAAALWDSARSRARGG